MALFFNLGGIVMILELLILIAVIGEIGFFGAFGLWLLSAAAGMFLIRTQGLTAWMRAQSSFQQGYLPVDELFESFCILFAGILLFIPGYLTDIFAIMLLFPHARRVLRRNGGRWFGWKEQAVRRPDDGVIEGSYTVVEEKPQSLPRHNGPDA